MDCPIDEDRSVAAGHCSGDFRNRPQT
jgi:hypothetical protein